ncbi:MAG: ParA family protein [Gammaproteobacteria bacterium]|nr:ParA family protein [Gammaproteobacteria bacterium]MCP5135684.1 ParA family protein [Gammaproteobacteria bacterium]
MKILATYNIKGGVGKTATAVNMAWLASRHGYRTLIWDLDPQGAASFYFRVKPKIAGGARGLLSGKNELDDVVKATDYTGLDLIPADFSYRNLDLTLADSKRPVKQLMKLLRPLSGEYDLLIIDSAPSISLVSENIFHAADALLVPMIPTTLSLRTYDQLRKYFRKKDISGVAILPFFSMADRRKSMHREIMEQAWADDPAVLKTDIPYSADVERMGLTRAPVGAYAPSSAPALAYEALWSEATERMAIR